MAEAGAHGASAPVRHVLIVDDSRAQRRLVALSLERWGYRVSEAATASEALALCTGAEVDIVLSDWMMPGMSGLELCRRIRALPGAAYCYFILLTSRSGTGEVVDGLDCGADDYLVKPAAPDELRARLRAGERVLSMQAELVDKNQLLERAFSELRTIYESLDRDLDEARRLQQSFARDRSRRFGRSTVTLLLRPSGHVGGDLAGSLELGAGRIALYSIDVSGHGVASALMTARLAGLLSGLSPEGGVARSDGACPHCAGHDSWPPEILAARLNRMMIADLGVEQYFTMAYAEIDLRSGALALVQAGHPHPVVLRADGRGELLGQGGLPVGLLPDATFERSETRLLPGDRLFLLSDGVTECPDPSGHELGEAGLVRLLAEHAALGSEELMEALVWALHERMGGGDFRDDVSGVLFDYRP
ncbi:PP2C family protein-serine/threonine phosphatase [Cereibacter johrii]|uniref:PP2C family protein-serine/threonine phosphatase n=1 Tax=Cereibacter johrii TaxID=445629 RepID=UPI0008466728|nr:SpoIIE family protein phosphatase [Cereibacter johrii]ODM42215.1 fused response regulator/phosphatase [Cereibacter johrii]